MPPVCQQFVIVVFPDHTHLLFKYYLYVNLLLIQLLNVPLSTHPLVRTFFQVGHARRQAVLQKQDKTMKQLQVCIVYLLIFISTKCLVILSIQLQ